MNPSAASKALFHYAPLRGSLFATALAVLLLVAGCSSTGSQHVWDANAIPASGSHQIRLRAKNADGSTTTVDYVRRDQVVQYREMVKNIGGTANQYVSKVVISDADRINAFAGIDKSGSPTIGITLKMLRLISDDPGALAALVGHEISHLKIGHSKDKAEFNAGAEAVATVAGIVLQAFGVPMAHTISGLGKGVVVAAYSREKETEADEMGIRLAYQSGYDPKGAVRLFQKLEQASSGLVIPFLSTHPISSERIENMAAIAATMASPPKSRTQTASAETSTISTQFTATETPPSTEKPSPTIKTTETPKSSVSDYKEQLAHAPSPRAFAKESARGTSSTTLALTDSKFRLTLKQNTSDQLWGYSDPAGRWVIEPIFRDARPFDSAGWAAAAIGDGLDVKWGFINSNGEWVVTPQFSEANDFDKEIKGFAKVRMGSKSFGTEKYLSRTGAIVDAPSQ